MEVFVARQPIFTKSEDVFGYELLYRNNTKNFFPQINGEKATAELIINSFLNIGIEKISNGKPCFINFTEKLLQLRLPTYFKTNEIVVEILETAEINENLQKICQELKELGYQIALDDFILIEDNKYLYRLLEYVDFIKVDFRNTDRFMRNKIEELAKYFKIKLIAEKIETRKEFTQAKSSGYMYFQGYFFAEPVIVSSKDIPTYYHSYYEIIHSLSESEPKINHLAKIIEKDLSLSYKLLKLLNSPAFRPRHKIKSIHQAIVMLGLIEVRKWIYVLAVRDTSGRKPEISNELITLSLIRAKMCELVAKRYRGVVSNSLSSYFLTGMFSLIDSLLNTPMDKVIKSLPLHDDLCNALRGDQNDLREILDLAISIEKGQWEETKRKCGLLNLDETNVLSSYQEALKWASKLSQPQTI